MKRGGLSIIKNDKLLSDSEINRLDLLEKEKCNKEIGLLMRKNKKFKKELTNSFPKYMNKLIVENDVTNDEIVTIKKDALFTINKRCIKNEFGYVQYRIKNKFDVYIKFHKNFEIFYNQENDEIVIKGISKNTQYIHRKGFIRFFKQVAFLCTYEEVANIREFIYEFAYKYVNKQLDFVFYKEFNELSHYMLNMDGNTWEYKGDIKNICVDYLDIGYNYMNYVVPFIQFFNK